MVPLTHSAICGCLQGLAVGDALGLPRENLTPARAARFFPEPALHHALFLGRGMPSDDTDHACLTAQALLARPLRTAEEPRQLDAFARTLQWKLKWWLASLPAGTGLATARALLKGWLGFGPHSAGVFSAGNGPAMRAPVLGVCLYSNPELLRAAVRSSTRITHTDPRAERGALWVAYAAGYGAVNGSKLNALKFLEDSRDFLSASPVGLDAEIEKIFEELRAALREQKSAAALAGEWKLARGVSGYIYHTVPLSIHAWLRTPGDFRTALETVIRLGGDADTTGALTGAIAGATVGVCGIPAEWCNGVWDYPRSLAWMEELARRLERTYFKGAACGPAPLFWPLLPVRNLVFLALVLKEGFRRLLPPYA